VGEGLEGHAVTIFVDDWMQKARVGRLNARWSHLTAGPFDDPAELHEFAERIGLKRSWYQGPPKHPWPRSHYDVTETKRQEAIRAGAVPITWREAGRQTLRARRAWKQAQNPVCTRTTDGKPPSLADMRVLAQALYDLAELHDRRTEAQDAEAAP
jgi:hypothetical protein